MYCQTESTARMSYLPWEYAVSYTHLDVYKRQIYNHSSIEITKRYLSIDQDDKDEVVMALNL